MAPRLGVCQDLLQEFFLPLTHTDARPAAGLLKNKNLDYLRHLSIPSAE